MAISKQHYHHLFENIHCKKNEDIIIKISEIIKPHSDAIATHFYNTMLGNTKAAYFINHDIVKDRLRASLSAWIDLAFSYKYNSKLITEYIDYQITIGHIHGRVDVPMSFVVYGMFIIKDEVIRLLEESSFNRDDLATAMILANQIMDLGLALINESYQGDLVVNEKDVQSFKLQFSTHNLAIDCERLRASLSDWMRELLLNIQQERINISSLPNIRHSNFGLWVTHKAKLFLADSEYEMLLRLLNNMDESMCALTAEFDQLDKRKEKLNSLDQYVSKTMWLLENIAKDIIAQDSGRDPLTRLFNRRYLDTVLRHETECSLKNNLTFGLVTLDIDFFKKINDTYGHDSGDKVLEQLANILAHQVRAGDFVFRLGGEEFLIVLSDIDEVVLKRIGEKIRLEVESTKFVIEKEPSLTVTISVGVAMHDGHPDFLRTIKLADEALYEAKRNGRNCLVVAA
ncbi:MAG: GGDEF domain-containing protein [Methylobacter tundripaludum]|uniref:Diguanylate cyclase DosC n=1 Tax=Methylobacter tundripaludum TaxID=173365 RepID=A0A2S6H5G4_9GAMM|nr:GGDEF domain-containing protein [Methylobacter tundripaludum]MCK9636132.1 GGDEF domain-containing protein [Methylobacter tundripaludum]PPK72704.1 diguanylate cyclase [Methylobacter tundripaludum]